MNKISRDINRRLLSAKNEIKRLKFKILKSINKNNERKYVIQEEIDKLSRNSSKTRIKNYCIITNRSKGIYKDFKLSRIVFRELALKGELPGIRKASW